jgi:hypothetical protein
MTHQRENPFASPKVHGGSRREPTEEFAPCPRCGGSEAKRITFTWWGGLLGPRLFTHVRCLDCGAKFNGRSGRFNTTAIVIYNLVAIGIVVALLLLLFGFVYSNLRG